jgi:N-acetyl-gamma-glutamyl-phosphate reductase
LAQINSNGDQVKVNFVPWRGDFTRGIFISSQLKSNLSLEQLFTLFEAFYGNNKFVQLSWEPIFLKQVVNTNKAVIQLEKIDNQLVVHSAIDNLLKGASGQAVQNMNLMLGFPEDTGLNLKASSF